MLTYMLVSLMCAQSFGCEPFKAPVGHLSLEECTRQRQAAWHEIRPDLYVGHLNRPKRWYKTDCVRER